MDGTGLFLAHGSDKRVSGTDSSGWTGVVDASAAPPGGGVDESTVYITDVENGDQSAPLISPCLFQAPGALGGG